MPVASTGTSRSFRCGLEVDTTIIRTPLIAALVLLSTETRADRLFDNIAKQVFESGELKGVPLEAKGNAEGTMAFVAFREVPEVALVALESGAVTYIAATPNGAGAFAVGLSNNVCH